MAIRARKWSRRSPWVLLLFACHVPAEVSASSELRRHHVGAQIGAFNPGAESAKVAGSEIRIDGIKGLGILSYRYSLNPHVDLAVELRHWIGRWTTEATGTVKIAAGFVGPGLRVQLFSRADDRVVRPYVQANVYYVQGQHTSSLTTYAHGVGVGISGGVELELTGLLSIPIEATYVRSGGDALHDLSGFGLSIGIGFSF